MRWFAPCYISLGKERSGWQCSTQQSLWPQHWQKEGVVMLTVVQNGDSQQDSPQSLQSPCPKDVISACILLIQGWDGKKATSHSLWGHSTEQGVGRNKQLLVFAWNGASIFKWVLCSESFCEGSVFLWGDFFFKFSYVIYLIQSFKHLQICFCRIIETIPILHLFILCYFYLIYQDSEVSILSF